MDKNDRTPVAKRTAAQLDSLAAESRNRTTHTYDQTTANEIARAITTNYLPEFGRFQKRFAELELSQT